MGLPPIHYCTICQSKSGKCIIGASVPARIYLTGFTMRVLECYVEPFQQG